MLPPPPLPTLNIDADRILVSGLSAGADFATQLQVAFSWTIMGLGVFAEQAYHCAVTRFSGEPSYPACNSPPHNQ